MIMPPTDAPIPRASPQWTVFTSCWVEEPMPSGATREQWVEIADQFTANVIPRIAKLMAIFQDRIIVFSGAILHYLCIFNKKKYPKRMAI